MPLPVIWPLTVKLCPYQVVSSSPPRGPSVMGLAMVMPPLYAPRPPWGAFMLLEPGTLLR